MKKGSPQHLSQSRQFAEKIRILVAIIPGDQKVSVHLMITIHISGAQRLFDHPVCAI